LLFLWGLALVLRPVQAQTPGEVRGSAVDAHGGEALADWLLDDSRVSAANHPTCRSRVDRLLTGGL
jgi:hypothetical protein